MAIFEQYLSEKDLQEICKYKYTAGMYTYLDDFLSEYFWAPLVFCCPEWLAPNVLTLFGFLMSLIGAGLTLYYSPQFESEIPSHICFIIAFCVFAYQTLDALDGKQARRTGASNSLGTLFDHGCDVVTTSFVVIINLGAFGCGVNSYSIASLVVTHLCQFICIWYEYYFNYFMAANNKFIGVTELQFGTMGLAILSGFFGQTWSRISIFGLPLYVILMVSMFSYQVYACSMYIIEGIYRLVSQQKSDNRDPSLKLRRAVTQISIFIPWIIIQWMFLREAMVIGNMCTYTALACVIVANATVCIRFILASCSHRTFHTVQWPIIPFAFVTLCLTFGNFFGLQTFQEYSKSHLNTVGLALFAYQILYFLDFVCDSINRMAGVLGIRVFKIKPKKVD